MQDMYQCKICLKYCKLAGGLHRHLILHQLTQEQYGNMYPGELDIYKKASNEKRKKFSPMCLEFYLSKYESREQAIVAWEKHKILKNEKVYENKFKNVRTYDYWLKNGYNKEQAKEIICKNNSRGLEFFIEKYGEQDGKLKFENFVAKRAFKNKKEQAVSLIMKKQNVDYQTALEIFKKKHRNGPKNKHYWLQRGYTENQAILKIKEISKQDSPRRREYWKIKYGMTEEQASIAVSNFQKRKSYSVSKESITVFDHCAKEFLKTFNLNKKDFLYGCRMKEMSLYDKDNDRVYFYDFCVPKLKIIIEYNGSAYHANPLHVITEQNKKDWFQCKSKLSYNDCYNRDENKKQCAINQGYLFYIIWDTDDFVVKCSEILKSLENFRDR